MTTIYHLPKDKKHKKRLNISMVKSLGETVVVGTCYSDKTKDFTFEAAIIDGVVTMAFDAVFHTLIWERSNK